MSQEERMETAITAIGTANPAYRQHQAKAAEIVAEALQLKPVEKRLLKSIYRATGIEYRHSVIEDFCKQPGDYTFFPNDMVLPFPSTAERMRLYKENALALCLSAIQDCLSRYPLFDKQTITHLITVSCTGMYAPGLDIEIVQQLNLSPHVKRTAINFMGCYGAFNGIKLADTICKADTKAKVLVICVELCTIHFQKNDSMDSLFSNAIFADGAACVLIEARPQRDKHFALTHFHCDLLPQHREEMAWHIADNGFDIVLSSYVPQAIQTGIADFTQRLLQQSQLVFDDIDLFAIHPGGQKILKACEAALTITPEQNRYAYKVLRDYGNMSSATIIFVLKAIWDDLDIASTGKKIFSCAFGPGLTLESMLLTVGKY